MGGLDLFLKKIWERYVFLSPIALEIKTKLEKQKDLPFFLDHIAFRTVNIKGVDVGSIEEVFLSKGYERVASYLLEDEKIEIFCYENKENPKILIAQLNLDSFSRDTKELFFELVNKNFNLIGDAVFYRKRKWQVSFGVYELLYSQSEYLAWMYAFGLSPSHFSFEIEEGLFSDLEQLNDWLESQGYLLNCFGSKIKGDSVTLAQSATMAQRHRVNFKEGPKDVPSCYCVFSKRYLLSGVKYAGFSASSLSTIFASSNKIE